MKQIYAIDLLFHEHIASCTHQIATNQPTTKNQRLDHRAPGCVWFFCKLFFIVKEFLIEAGCMVNIISVLFLPKWFFPQRVSYKTLLHDSSFLVLLNKWSVHVRSRHVHISCEMVSGFDVIKLTVDKNSRTLSNLLWKKFE